MSHSGDTNVPKFGSFKSRRPNKPVTSNSRHEPRSGQRQRNNDDLRSREHTSDSSSRPRHRKESHHESKRQRTRSESPKEAPVPEPFIVDLRGDPRNVEYGSLHRYSVPIYHRAGRGSVIGAPPNVKIDRDASTEKEVVLRVVDGTKGDRRVLSASKANITSEKPSAIFRRGRDETETELDFLSLKRTKSLNDDYPSNEVGAGIWSFIEAAESFDGQET